MSSEAELEAAARGHGRRCSSRQREQSARERGQREPHRWRAAPRPPLSSRTRLTLSASACCVLRARVCACLLAAAHAHFGGPGRAVWRAEAQAAALHG